MAVLLAVLPLKTYAIFEPVSAFSDRETLPSSSTLKVWSAPVNFETSTGWEKMDLDLYADITGWHVKKAPYSFTVPDKARGEMAFTGDVSLSRQFPDASMVTGVRRGKSAIVYPVAFPKIQASLIVEARNDGIAYIIEWPKYPTLCDSQESLDIPISLSPEAGAGIYGFGAEKEPLSRNSGVYSKLEVANGEKKVFIRSPRVWDAIGASESISFVGSVEQISKVIPCSFFRRDEALYPIHADDVVSIYPAGNSDGPIQTTYNASGDTWANIIGAAGGSIGLSDTDGLLSVYRSDDESNKWRYVGMGGYCFDTGTELADNAVVDSASVFIFGFAKSGDANAQSATNVNLYGFTPAAPTLLVASDFSQRQSTAFSDAITYSSWLVDSANEFALNGDGIANISTTAYSCFSTRLTNDASGIAPSWYNNESCTLSGYFSEQAGTGSDPYIEITYHIPASSSSSSSTTSSAGSSYSFDSGTGTLMTNTGSLVGVVSVCDHYTIVSGTGSVLSGSTLVDVPVTTSICDQWSYGIKIPFVAYVFRANAGTLFTFGAWILMVIVGLWVLLKIAGWFFRLFTFRL